MTRVAAATPGDPPAERMKARRPPLPGLNKPAANDPIDDAISVYAYKAVTAVAESIANAVGAVRAWRARNAAISELSRLNDHLLKDIGIHRGEIRAVVDEMLSRPQAQEHRPALRAVTDQARPAANDNDYTEAA